jgi:hypothetical protein
MMRWRRASHLDDETLARLIDDGERQDSLSAAQSAHLGGCEQCRQMLAGHRQARALLLRAHPNAELPARSSGAQLRFASPLGLATMGAVILVVALGTAGLVVQRANRQAPAGATSVEGWSVLATTDIGGAYWSPDGKWFLLWSRPGYDQPAPVAMELHDAKGHLVKTVPFGTPIWVDGRSFIVETAAGSAVLATVDSATVEPVSANLPLDSGSAIVSNGHGAVAFSTAGANTTASQFAIWTPQGVSRQLPGQPAAWSRDGSKLAVWHYQGPIVGADAMPGGWMEVLSWPDLKELVALPDTSVAGFTSFDPSGLYLLLPGTGSVLDVTTGARIQVVPDSTAFDRAAWDQNSNLIIQEWTGGASYPVTTYSLDGKPLWRSDVTGDSLVGTLDGKTVVGYYGSRSQKSAMTVIRDGVVHDVALPGPLLFGPPQLSADGSAVVVLCNVGGRSQILLGSI